MSGRRSHVRFALNGVSEGILRVLRGVELQCAEDGSMIALSHEPASIGQRFVVNIPDGHAGLTFDARVVESRPVLVNGSVRHRLHLQEER